MTKPENQTTEVGHVPYHLYASGVTCKRQVENANRCIELLKHLVDAWDIGHDGPDGYTTYESREVKAAIDWLQSL